MSHWGPQLPRRRNAGRDSNQLRCDHPGLIPGRRISALASVLAQCIEIRFKRSTIIILIKKLMIHFSIMIGLPKKQRNAGEGLCVMLLCTVQISKRRLAGTYRVVPTGLTHRPMREGGIFTGVSGVADPGGHGRVRHQYYERVCKQKQTATSRGPGIRWLYPGFESRQSPSLGSITGQLDTHLCQCTTAAKW